MTAEDDADQALPPLGASEHAAIPEEILYAEPDSDAFAVWADELMRSGDAWGELVQLCRARETTMSLEIEDRIQNLAAKFGRTWWGDVPSVFAMRFKDGFVDALGSTVGGFNRIPGVDRQLEFGFLAKAIFWRLRRVAVDAAPTSGGLTQPELDGMVRALAAKPRPCLRTVELGRAEHFDETTGDVRIAHMLSVVLKDGGVRFSDWARLFAVAPNLEHFVVADGFVVSNETALAAPLVGPKLKTLCLGFRPVSEAILTALGSAYFPKLEVLALRIGDPFWSKVSANTLRQALHNPSLSNLRSLALVCGHEISEALPVLASAPFFPNLQELHLGGAHATDAAWAAFNRQALRAPRLERVHISRERQSVSAEYAISQHLPVVWCDPDVRYV